MKGDAALARDLGDRARPVVLAGEQLVPVISPLAGLFTGGGMRRGSTMTTAGPAARSLAFALAVAPSASGSWVAIVGLADLGLAAADEMGVDLRRIVVADPSPGQWVAAVAALVGSVDVVVICPPRHVKESDVGRLQARARERGTVLISVGPLNGVDVNLTVTASRWHGVGAGHGVLQYRQVTVEATGRREATRPRRVEVLLPGPSGRVEVPSDTGSWAGSDITHLIDAERPALFRDVG